MRPNPVVSALKAVVAMLVLLATLSVLREVLTSLAAELPVSDSGSPMGSSLTLVLDLMGTVATYLIPITLFLGFLRLALALGSGLMENTPHPSAGRTGRASVGTASLHPLAHYGSTGEPAPSPRAVRGRRKGGSFLPAPPQE